MNTEIRDILENLRPLFERTACELTKMMFNTDPVLPHPWSITDHIDREHEYIFTLVSFNKRFKARTILGASQTTLDAFIGHHVSLEDAKDALGEYANDHCAMLMDDPDYLEAFGFMRQNPPEDVIGLGFFPQAWALHGHMMIGDQSMYFAYAVERQRISMNLLDSLDILHIPAD